MNTPNPSSLARFQRVVGRAWDRSIAKHIWDDLTPFGQWTIGVPLIVIVVGLLPFVLLMCFIVFCLVRGVEPILGGIYRAFFK